MDDEEKVFYYMIGSKMYKYDSEDSEGNGIVLDNMINQRTLFYWKDAVYAADDETLYQISDGFYDRIVEDVAINWDNITCVTFFISDISLFVSFHLLFLTTLMTSIMLF